MARSMLALLLVAFALASSHGAAAGSYGRRVLQGNDPNTVSGATNILAALGSTSTTDTTGATALLTAATQGGASGQQKAAQSLVANSNNPSKLSSVLRNSAKGAKNQQQKQALADTQATALIQAQNSGKLSSFAPALAQSLDPTDQSQKQITANAIASAAAQGPSGQQAAADATASVYCDQTKGALSPSAAAAWGASYAVAIAQDPTTGCITLTEAFASALATCGANGAQAITKDQSISQQLGTCQKIPGFVLPSFAIAGGVSGGTSTGNAGGSSSAGGKAIVPSPSNALRGCAATDTACILQQFGR